MLLYWNKDIAELDGGKAASIDFPEPNDLTVFNVKVSGHCSELYEEEEKDGD